MLLGVCFFLPMAIVSYINRPKDFHFTETAPAAMIAQTPTEQHTPVTLNPVQINAMIQKPKTKHLVDNSTKVYVCRDIEMLNGGQVRHCDWI